MHGYICQVRPFLQSMAILAKYPFPSNINEETFVTLKLNDMNYLMWETQVLSSIESQQLLKILSGETVTPLHNSANYSSWIRADRLVKSWIIGTLSKEVSDLL